MSARIEVDPALKQWATEAQAKVVDAIIAHGSARKAGAALGVHHSYVARVIGALQRKAAIKPRGTTGFVPREVTTHYDGDGTETGSTVKEGPESWAEPGGIDAGPARDGHSGYAVKGVSTYYDAEGQQRGQWVKTKVEDAEREATLRAAIEAMAEELPRVTQMASPTALMHRELLNLFTLTDAHVGMLAWHKEGGADWDLGIAENTLVAAFEDMIHRAPAAATAVLNQLGDFLHFDGLDAVTPMNRHLLDADGRFRKITRVAIRILRRIIDILLATHDRVHVICAEGNHDLASSGWLALMLDAIYENEPRVIVDQSPLPFYRVRFGSVFLGFHHGHMKAKESLPLLFAQQFREEWGQTAHSYLHTGHRHHFEERDVQGVRLVEHATLAARDAYAARHGYLAARQALAITYHEDFGEFSRLTVTPEMLRLAA